MNQLQGLIYKYSRDTVKQLSIDLIREFKHSYNQKEMNEILKILGIDWYFKDYAWLASWEVHDLDFIARYFQKIRETENLDGYFYMFNQFIEIQNKIYNDHKNAKIAVTPLNLVSPIAVSRSDDIMTLKGVMRMMRHACILDTNLPWTHAAVGTNLTPPEIWNEVLGAEVSVTDFANNGLFKPMGTAIGYGGIFGESVATNTYTESLVRDQSASSGSTCLVRNTYTDFPINHTAPNSGFTIGGVLEFVPTVDVP